MKTITYRDLEGAAPTVELKGVTFEDGTPTEVSDEIAGFLAGNPFFDDGDGADAADADDAKLKAIREKGFVARADGKPRNVPVAYRGKPAEAAWLAGFDDGDGA